MASSFQQKTSRIFLTLFIGLIVISFMFTGYESLRGTPNEVANVGGIPIKMSEYQQEFNRQLQFYQQITGGKPLTSQEIERFNVRGNTLQSLIQRKLFIKFADKLGAHPSPEQIKEEIKNLPYFQTNKKFDISLYKNLLAANGLTPAEFEEDIKESVKGNIIQPILNEYPLSNKYQKELEQYRNQKITATAVQFNQGNLKKFVPVSTKELNEFLAKEENKKRVEDLFSKRKGSLDQKEEVLARHILLKVDDKKEDLVKKEIEKIAKEVTPSNFSKMANKYTEDISGKGNGGNLGWFARGRMVPEFEKVAFSQKAGTISGPVKTQFGYHLIYVENKKAAKEAKLSEHQKDLAQELVQNSKEKEIDQLASNLSKEIEGHLKQGNIKKVESMKEKYGFTFLKETTANRLDGVPGLNLMNSSDIRKIFSNTKSPSVYNFSEGSKFTIVRTIPYQAKKADEREAPDVKLVLARKVRENAIKALKEDINIKVNSTFIN